MKYFFLILFIGIILCAWCPWLKDEEALQIVDAHIIELQKAEPNLCPLSVNKDSLSKIIFGYTIEISYDCSTVDATFGIAKSTDTIFITFFKDILGIPKQYVISQK